MRKLRQGTMLGEYRVGELLERRPGRMEYEAFPMEGGCAGVEYRVITFNTDELPDEYLKPDYGDVIPWEIYFLENRCHWAFPFIIDSGDNGKFLWIVTRLKAGLTVRRYINFVGAMSQEQALKTVFNLCSYVEKLGCCDNDQTGHFNITPDTVRVLSDTDSLLEGFGYASPVQDNVPFSREINESSYYLAPELFIGLQSSKADVYGLCMILYMLITGKEFPWQTSMVNTGSRDKFVVSMGMVWNSEPDLDDIQSKQVRDIIYNGLATNPTKRFENVLVLKDHLAAVLEKDGCDDEKVVAPSVKEFESKGFKAVAGLDHLKKQMYRKFILPIRKSELAKTYRITPPNGCLLFGPHGCGKTFVVEKIAEEAGIPCEVFRPSDMASIYIHGGQEKIREIFDEMREKAPIMVCFDEADAVMSSRTRPGNEHYAGEVNEFLTQLNNAAKDGVYVFLMTNHPELLDDAALRTGRVDEKFYIPLPDSAARMEFFRIGLAGIPTDGDVDYARLAELTDGMSFSDLDYIVAESNRNVFVDAADHDAKEVLPVTQAVIEGVIATAPKSVSSAEVKRFEALRDQFENSGRGREKLHRKIGY